MKSTLKRIFSLIKLDNSSLHMNIICYYRFISLILASIFYIFCMPKLSLNNKFVFIICLSISSLILNYMYMRYKNLRHVIISMLIIESISNVVILIPTGGLSSPYIWYSLNTVIIGAYFFNAKYIYLDVVSYLLALTMLYYYIFPETQKNIMQFFIMNSNLILSYLLIGFAIKSLMQTGKQLNNERDNLFKLNCELQEANNIINNTLGNITYLYQSIQNFSNIKDEQKLSSIITKYITEISNSPLSFSLIFKKHEGYCYEISKEIPHELKTELLDKLVKTCNKKDSGNELYEFHINDHKFIGVCIKSSNRIYGMLGMELVKSPKIIEKEQINQILYLATLSVFMLEKLQTDSMNELLLISEEQNRIANELHDSASQRLFFTSSKIHSLISNLNSKNLPDLKSELSLVKDSISLAMKELRNIIYCYSEANNEHCLFERNLRSYLDEISEFSGVTINYNITGDYNHIRYDFKKAIYRIISESIGNSIKHGRSKNINLSLVMEPRTILISISDDGLGFDTKSKLSNRTIGLGLKNLQFLTYSYNGSIKFTSQPNKGTSIKITFPMYYEIISEQGDAI